MRRSKSFFALLLVVCVLTAAILACNLYDFWSGDVVETPIPFATRPIDAIIATGEALQATAIAQAPPLVPSKINALWQGSDQTADVYSMGTASTTPFSQLFGSLDQAATITSLKAAVPDLKFTQRMVIQQGAWTALAFDLSGTFTQPLMTASGALPPTNKSWFTTVHMVAHVDADGKIDQEYSVTDMAAMLHEAGVPGYENVEVQTDIEKSMPEDIPNDDPSANALIDFVLMKVGGGPFSTWLPSGVPKDMPTSYHSPYGDADSKLPEVESKLLLLHNAQVVVPVIIRQGNAVGVLYRYNGTVKFPVQFSNGTTLPPSDTMVQFFGIALGSVDAQGQITAWNMINRLNNPISPDTYAPAPGVTTAQAVAPEVTPRDDDFGYEDEEDGDAADTELPPATNDQSTPPAPAATAEVDSAAAPSVTCALTAPQKANLRSGPGTSFAVGGSLSAGQSAEADGHANDANGRAWYHLSAEDLWVRSDLVSGECASLPTIAPG